MFLLAENSPGIPPIIDEMILPIVIAIWIVIVLYLILFDNGQSQKFKPHEPPTSAKMKPSDTIPFRLILNSHKQGEKPAYWTWKDETWQSTSWSKYVRKVRDMSKSLLSLGIKSQDRICIIGKSCPEWCISAVAAMCIGAIPIGIHQTSSVKDTNYILEHSKAKLVIVENSKQFVKIKKPIKTIIIEECKVLSTEVIFWKDLPKTTLSDDIIDECIATLDLKEPAVIIYTVTGSGPPLAAVLSHQNIAWTSQIAAQIGNVTKKTISLSYLPLSHIAEQLFTIHMHISIGYQVYFTKDKHIFKSMKSVRPTHLFGVPRVWEKLAESIESKMYSSTPFYGYLILCWAMGISKNVSALVRSGNTVSGLLSWKYGFVRGWIFPSIKEALGLSRMEVGVSGGAPISQETLTFFSSIDVPIIEVYGLSETSGVASANLFNQNKFGSVGFAPNGIDIKIIDGEICVRGPNVFLGYDQDEKSTEKVFIDGWLRTGDLGKIDSNGFIYITGRKKNIVITSGGKNISPENVEKMILKNPLISDCVVLADKRKFVVAILKLNEKEADLVAIRLACKYPLHECPIMYKEVNNWIKTVNNDLSKPEMIRCLKIVKTMNQDGSRRKNMEEEHKDWLDKQMNSIK